MPLEMRANCEKCDRALGHGDEAYVCSYECTFCSDCTAAMGAVCPNCGGELLRRPRRAAGTETVDEPKIEGSVKSIPIH